jgi:hypothetical protein
MFDERKIANALTDTGLVPICRPVSRNLMEESRDNRTLQRFSVPIQIRGAAQSQ